MVIDPVCLFHGKKMSEHEGGRCLYCSLCFDLLTPDECAVDEDGQKWDICIPCYEAERLFGKMNANCPGEAACLKSECRAGGCVMEREEQS